MCGGGLRLAPAAAAGEAPAARELGSAAELGLAAELGSATTAAPRVEVPVGGVGL